MANEYTIKERAVRARLRDDFAYYAPRCLKIITKPDAKGQAQLVPFRFNSAQSHAHRLIEAQLASLGYVRAIILKGRQQGISTYVEGRFYAKTSQRRGQKTYILTHKQEATDNLFSMVERYHDNAPAHVRPHVGRSNAKELVFDLLDSRYQVATAGAKGSGRSATLTNLHGSEVAFWENGSAHLAGMLQAVPLGVGTEVIMESTANGVGNVFHEQWVMAERGESDFIAIFIPWFWQDEYRRKAPADFVASDDRERVPEGELTEAEYQEAYGLTDEQVFWRRRKIVELGGGESGYWLFKQEYPATADEAFQSSHVGNSLLSRRQVLRARKSPVRTDGPLIIGVDPGGHGDGGDPTAIIRRRTRRLYDPQTFSKLTTMQIVALLHRIIKGERPVRMFIDVGGLGAGIVDRLAELEGTAGIVVPVNFGEAALDPDLYKNRRAEMAWKLSEWLDDPAGVSIPDSDEIQADFLASVIAPEDSNQRRQLRSKEWMRSKGLRSPNLFDAACLTFALPIGATVGVQGNAGSNFDPIAVSYGDGGGFSSSYQDFDVF